MDSSAIDLSGGFVAKQNSPQSGGIDLSGGFVPNSGNKITLATAPQSSQEPYPKAYLTDNSNKEGLYRFIDTNKVDLGDNATPEQVKKAMLSAPVIYVPYSKALELLGHPEQHVGVGPKEMDAYNQGNSSALDKYGLTLHPDEAQSLYNDSRNDPNLKGKRLQNFVSTIPAAQAAAGFARSGAKTVSGADTIIRKATGTDKGANGQPRRTQAEQAVQHFADTPVHNGFEGMEGHESESNYLSNSQGLGEGAEDMGEFLSGEGLLSALGKIAKAPVALSEAAKIEQEIKKGSTMGKLALAALKQGTVAGGQTYVKTGGDTGAALRTGAATAGVSGGLGALAEGAESYIGRNMTTLENVGGIETPVPAEVRNVQETPQQTAGKQAIRSAAQDTLAQHLQEVNESRAVPESAPALPARTGPYEFQLKGIPPTNGTTGQIAHDAAKFDPAASRVPEGGTPGPQNKAELGSTASTIPDRMQKRVQAYTPAVSDGTEPQADVASGGGTLHTQDPNVAKAHIGNLNRVIESDDFQHMPEGQQRQLLEARADAQRQIREYHDQVRQNLPGYGKPNFPQISIPQTVKKVGSYTEAAQHLEGIATDGYNNIADALALNDISGGKFAAIRNANKEAWNAYKGASSVEAMTQAEQSIDETNRQMQSLLRDDIGGAVTPKELDGFNDAYGNAQKLKYVAHAVDSAFSGNASTAARSWEYRGFDGNRLMANLSRLQQKFGRGSLERVVGRDNLNTLFQVAELNRTGAARARFGAAVKPIADWMNKAGAAFSHLAPMAIGAEAGRAVGLSGWTGAAAGEAVALASKRVMDAVLSNPKIAQNLLFAIDSGANPEHYAPLIGTMIQRMETARSRQEQQQQQPEEKNREDEQ